VKHKQWCKTAVDVKVLEIAENLISKGFDNPFIVDITGLTLAQLQELRKAMK
jgi:ribosomal protein L10